MIESARAGSVEHQLALGMSYLQDGQADYQEAAYWLEQASRNGDQLAQFQMALLAANGKGVRKDLNKAAELLEQCQSTDGFERLSATYQTELDDLRALLSAAEQDHAQPKILPLKVKSPAMKRRLREMTRKDKRIFDRAWIWAMFLHVSVATLCVEVALSHQPVTPSPSVQIELCSIEQLPELPAKSMIAPPYVPPTTSQNVVSRTPITPTTLTSALPATPSDVVQSHSADADTAGVGGAQGRARAARSLPLDWSVFESSNTLFAGSSTGSGAFDGWGSYEGSGTATGTGAWDTGSAFGKGGSALCRDLFAKHDVAIIIDKSGSMRTPDCPGDLTRWEWCREQTAGLTELASKYGNAYGPGVTVFSDNFVTYRHTKLDMISDIFRTNEPNGGTQLAAALKSQLDDYFWTSRNKPLVIAVITDGVPNDPDAVCDAIISATKQMRFANEIKITFLQIGEDPIGDSFASYLDQNLVSDGARFDIVYSKRFSQLKHAGVIGALLEVVAGQRKVDRIPVEDALIK